MIIGKKSVVGPCSLAEINNERIKDLFSDRSLLHANSIPEFSIYIDEPAWNTFLKRANNEYTIHNNEASGIILGHYFSDRFGKFIVGIHFEAGYGQGTSSVFCEISIQDQIRILQKAKDHNLLQLIWIHSHPTFGAFFSTVDYRTLKSMYYAPHQAGIVVDNVNQEYLGFKVRNNNAYDFKEIFLVSLNDPTLSITRPFGKNPDKIFYARKKNSSNLNKTKVPPVSLKDKRNEKIKGEEILSLLSQAIDDLKLVLNGRDKKNDSLDQNMQSWEMKIKEIEHLLNEKYGEKSYKSVAPCFARLNEMRVMINEGAFPESQASLLDKMKELLNNLPG